MFADCIYKYFGTLWNSLVITQDSTGVESKLLAGLLSTDRNPVSKFCLGNLYIHGDLAIKNYQHAFRYYMESASMEATGDLQQQYQIFAMHNVGVMLLHGTGTKQDQSQAFGWILKAALMGHGESLWLLGKMYQSGTGVNPDYDLAWDYYNRAAEQQHHLAKIKIAGSKLEQLDCWPVKFLSIMDERSSYIAGNKLYPVPISKSLPVINVQKIIELYNKNKDYQGVCLQRDIHPSGTFYGQKIGYDTARWLMQLAHYGIHRYYYLIGNFYFQVVIKREIEYAKKSSHFIELICLGSHGLLAKEYKDNIHDISKFNIEGRLLDLNLFMISYVVAKISFSKALSGGYKQAAAKLEQLEQYAKIEKFHHENIMYNYGDIFNVIQEDYRLFAPIEELLVESMFYNKLSLATIGDNLSIYKNIRYVWRNYPEWDKFKRLLFIKKIIKDNINVKLSGVNCSLLDCLIDQQDLISIITLLDRSDLDVNFNDPLVFSVKNCQTTVIKLLLSHPDVDIYRQCDRKLSGEQIAFLQSIVTAENYTPTDVMRFSRSIANLHVAPEEDKLTSSIRYMLKNRVKMPKLTSG